MLDKCLHSDYNKITENEQMFGGGKIMSLGSTLLTIFEVALVAFTIWAVFHESLFVEFEEKLVAHFRRRKFKVIKGSNIAKSYYPEKYRA